MSVMFDPETAIYPFPAKPQPLTVDEKQFYREKIKRLLRERDAVMVAHYYTDPEIQQLAEETGGCIADSLEMARFGARHSASTLLVAGVRFMGETAKILSPEKTILMPTLNAECSLDLGCPIEEFNAFCDAHPDRTVVVYANTSAAVKARADWVVTSSIAANSLTIWIVLVKRSSGRRTATLGVTFSVRPAQTCCAGRGRASCTTSLKPRR